MNSNIIKKIKIAPPKPGVYIFYKNLQPLYIGKSANLKSRLNSYLKIHDLKTKILNEEANKLKIIELRSPIEALIEESKLIKKLKPKYNILWRDDKNYFYVAFTQENFSKVFITHQVKKFEIKNLKLKINYIGPFTDGASLKIVLKILRHHFPYCTCFQSHRRECLNAQIGNCLGVCCVLPLCHDRGTMGEYAKNIRAIKNILLGKDKKFLKNIFTPSELYAVENIYDHASFLDSSKNPVIQKSKNPEIKISKIECYDVSHFSGKEAVGAMTALINDGSDWKADPSLFRKFKIKNLETKNDPAMIAEILTRRFNHPEWPYPDLIIIDGGIAQYQAAVTAYGKWQITNSKPTKDRLYAMSYRPLVIIAFAKPQKKIIGENPNISTPIIEQAIKQTHRFVISYHRKLRNKVLSCN